MSDDDLSIQGTLAETTVPDLFRSIIRSQETGIVSLDAVGRHDSIFIREGKIVFASSSDSDLGLGEVLLRTGELNLLQYTAAMEHLTSPRKIGAVLCDLGYLKPDELIRAVERQVSIIVMHALAFRTGSYTVEFTQEFSGDISTISINTERLILDGVARIEPWSLIARGVARMERLLRQAPGADARIFHLDLNEEESHVYGLLYEPQTVQGVCERSYLSNFVACRTLWALLATNLIEDAVETDAGQQRALVESEYELESEVEKYNSAFQQIFAIVFQESGDRTYDLVDRVILGLSGDVLPYLSGINLLNEGRVDFDQLHNNVIASGSSDRHVIVQSVMTELLYSWIVEVRRELQGRLEPEMFAILQTLKK
jgi:Domain of unknown function (DUF4388)